MKIIVIVGTTGVGKTKLSIELAKKINAVIINGDSMQVYKSLDIGTAKIKESEKEGIEHYLFDICTPLEDYNIYKYEFKDAIEIAKKAYSDYAILIVGSFYVYKTACEVLENDRD